MKLETLQCPGCWQHTLPLLPVSLYNSLMYCGNTFCGTIALVHDPEATEEEFSPREALAIAHGIEAHQLQYFEQKGFDVIDEESQDETFARTSRTLVAAKKYPIIVSEEGAVTLSPPPNRPLNIVPEQFDAELELLWQKALKLLEDLGEAIFPNTPAGWAVAAVHYFNFSRLMQRVAQIRFAKLVLGIQSGEVHIPDVPPDGVFGDEDM